MESIHQGKEQEKIEKIGNKDKIGEKVRYEITIKLEKRKKRNNSKIGNKDKNGEKIGNKIVKLTIRQDRNQ